MATGRVPTTANSPLTAKGDLFGYSTTQARVPVGNDGETLVADSSASTGLRWQSNFAAGKNVIINGDCRINQRSFTSTTTSDVFGVDRWSSTFLGGTNTFSVQSFTPGSAPVTGYEAVNFMRLATTGQTLGSQYSIISYRVEDVRTFANQTATISFWAKAGSGTPSIAVNAVQVFGTGGSAGVYNYPATRKVSITTGWQRYSFVIPMASISGKTIGSNSYIQIYIWTSAGSNFNTDTDSMGLQSATIDVWGLQFEAGNVATAFQTATGTLAGELAACQRYYCRFEGSQYSTVAFGGCGQSANQIVAYTKFPVTMRIAPTSADWANLAAYDQITITGTPTSFGIAANETTKDVAAVAFNKTGAFTQFRPYVIIANNNTAGYLAFSAEL